MDRLTVNLARPFWGRYTISLMGGYMRKYAWLFLSIGLTFGLVGCGDSESSNGTGGTGGGSGGTGGSGGGTGMATVSGTVFSASLDDVSTPLQGATVMVVGGSSTTSGSDGSFSLQAPVGIGMFRTTAPNAWGELATGDVPAGGEDMAEAEVVPDALVGMVAAQLMEMIDPTKGMVIVEFDAEVAVGGETADLGSSYGFAFVFRANGDVVIDNQLEAGDDAQVLFANVDVTSDVMPSAGMGGGSCTLEFPSTTFPSEAKVFTIVDVASCP